MEILIFILSATILFGAFKLFTSMPKMPKRTVTDYEKYFENVSERIASIKEPQHITTAEITRELFANRFREHPMIRRDSKMLELQIEGKKRMLGGGLWL